MAVVTVEGYLVQDKLAEALRAIVGEANWRGQEVRLPVGHRRWDMSHAFDNRITVVEFDGDQHYHDTLKIKADVEKNGIADQHGFRVVRIPYWVRLTTETLAHYFGLSATVQQTFPHGFIATKIFPASFCALGVERFMRELDALPLAVRAAYVVPNALHAVMR